MVSKIDLDRAIFVDVEMRVSRDVDAWHEPPMIGVLLEGVYTAYACKPFLKSSVE